LVEKYSILGSRRQDERIESRTAELENRTTGASNNKIKSALNLRSIIRRNQVTKTEFYRRESDPILLENLVQINIAAGEYKEAKYFARHLRRLRPQEGEVALAYAYSSQINNLLGSLALLLYDDRIEDCVTFINAIFELNSLATQEGIILPLNRVFTDLLRQIYDKTPILIKKIKVLTKLVKAGDPNALSELKTSVNSINTPEIQSTGLTKHHHTIVNKIRRKAVLQIHQEAIDEALHLVENGNPTGLGILQEVLFKKFRIRFYDALRDVFSVHKAQAAYIEAVQWGCEITKIDDFPISLLEDLIEKRKKFEGFSVKIFKILSSISEKTRGLTKKAFYDYYTSTQVEYELKWCKEPEVKQTMRHISEAIWESGFTLYSRNDVVSIISYCFGSGPKV
jgi:hypothetical protein